MMNGRYQAKRVFTLIELMVVISVIAILAALLLPALRSAKLTAIEIACKSNLRQFGMALYSYMNDESGWLVPKGGWGGSATGKSVWWQDNIFTYTGLSSRYTEPKTALYK